jgi:exodeoxyribonuclease-3
LVADLEGRIVSAKYPGFRLFNVYVPNGKASDERLQFKMDFYRRFLIALNKLTAQGEGVVVCGDVNTAHKEIDLARPKENRKISGFLPQECAWMDELVAAGFHDTLRLVNPSPGQYTWWDMKSGARERNVGWRIDYFFVSDNLKSAVKAAGILPEVRGSDHCPVSLTLELG